MAEIDDDKLAQLQSAYDLMNSLYSDKDHGIAFKKMMKAKRSEANIPELDIIDTVTKPYDEKMTALAEENKKLQTKVDEFLSKQQQRDDEHQVQLTLAQVQEKYKLTDDGMGPGRRAQGGRAARRRRGGRRRRAAPQARGGPAARDPRAQAAGHEARGGARAARDGRAPSRGGRAPAARG